MFLNDKGYIYEQDTQVIMIQGAEVTLRTDDFGISSNDSMWPLRFAPAILTFFFPFFLSLSQNWYKKIHVLYI